MTDLMVIERQGLRVLTTAQLKEERFEKIMNLKKALFDLVKENAENT